MLREAVAAKHAAMDALWRAERRARLADQAARFVGLRGGRWARTRRALSDATWARDRAAVAAGEQVCRMLAARGLPATDGE
jgi:hypothetical protein